jgi:hypothetical protein
MWGLSYNRRGKQRTAEIEEAAGGNGSSNSGENQGAIQ